MKIHLKVIFLVVLPLMVACNSNSQMPNSSNPIILQNEKSQSNELNKMSLDKLFELISKENKNAELRNDEIIIGKSKIKVIVSLEQEEFSDDKYFFAARFDTRLVTDKEYSFIVGSIGIGNDKDDAVKTSVDEWVEFFGVSLSSLVSDPNSKLIVNEFNVFSGLMGIRGEKNSQNWINGSPEMNSKIIDTLLPIIRNSKEGITSINLMFTANETGITSGECRMNNEVSDEILEQLKKLDWKSSNPYMFKQYYLIKKK